MKNSPRDEICEEFSKIHQKSIFDLFLENCKRLLKQNELKIKLTDPKGEETWGIRVDLRTLLSEPSYQYRSRFPDSMFFDEPELVNATNVTEGIKKNGYYLFKEVIHVIPDNFFFEKYEDHGKNNPRGVEFDSYFFDKKLNGAKEFMLTLINNGFSVVLEGKENHFSHKIDLTAIIVLV